MLVNKCNKIFIILIATLWCGYQLHTTLYNYFGYVTMSKLELLTPEMLVLMSVSLCMPFLSFLNRDFVRKRFNVDLDSVFNVSHDVDHDDHREIIENKITIREIFKETYPVDKIITSCSIRYLTSRFYSDSNDSKFM